MYSVRQNPIQRTARSVCITLCTTVAHNTTAKQVAMVWACVAKRRH